MATLSQNQEREKENKSTLDVFSFQNILKAYFKCRENKRKTINALKFEIDFEPKILTLEKELKNRTYSSGQSICFVITDPKPREVFAADFRDRVIHHLLVGYLEPIWEKMFIYQSYSCRKNKGACLAIKDLKKYSAKISHNFSKPAYYLHIDISAFFMSLKKDILFKIIKRHTKNPDILWLTQKIIFQDPIKNYYYKGNPNLRQLIPPHKSLFHVPKNQGLPIGNLTSQFFANVYLNEIDQFAKHQLKIKYYLRYVDDLLLLSQDTKQLIEWRDKIDYFLRNNLKLKLHPKKQVLQSIYKGANFIGFIVKPRHTFIRNRIVKKLKCKLYYFNKKIIDLDIEHPIRMWTPELCNDFKKIFATVNSYYGQFKHANTFRLREHLYKKHFGILKIYLLPVNEKYDYFIWDED